MHGWYMGLLGLIAVTLTGCAGHRAAQTQNLNMQVARLDGRVSMLENHLGLIEGKAWNQREDVSYLRGRVEGMQGGFSQSARAAAVKSTPRRIQTALKNAGYYTGSVDGKVGSQTKQAIKEFQRTHGLSADGKVGQNTWTQLAQYLPAE
ncbi:MAG: peptidoglycan-binding domain-containing protein [Candidatus Omnitrophota bacterium]|nr:peptidoglycan-binding domain-containing protein [Candidatus Omnitrophota bacterium]